MPPNFSCVKDHEVFGVINALNENGQSDNDDSKQLDRQSQVIDILKS